MDILTILLRVVLAVVLGGLVGIERENKKRAAGFRTHILVCLGSALVMITSEYIFQKYKGMTNIDPARLGAQVISGIGFLGAGTILRQGASITGLTTAASLWAVSCIGLAVGIGFYEAAVIVSLFVFVTLFFLTKFEHAIVKGSNLDFDFRVKLDNHPGKIGEVTTTLGKQGVNIRNIVFEVEDENTSIIKFTVLLPKGADRNHILDCLKDHDGVMII